MRTVFVDRDGTLNRKAPPGQYVTRWQDLVLLPGVAQAVRRLNRSGRQVIVVTNQRGVARGLMSQASLDAVHHRLRELVGQQGARLDAIYCCAHAAGRCGCRKPQPGMLLAAAADRPGVDLADAVLIGDAETDVAAGRAAGVRTVRLAAAGTRSAADHVVRDLPQAVEWILCGGAG
ncbi:HAD family hydrolase [Saccharopolyspora sp. NPDC000359]|uniref:D-glycero-alpha-D-manno-heptose-1,7-bisphosphate 7-phosphatase n=1 Tax=Saccharopolyspora sp. NPDC000359 TaxID=3154251 RepID=UPI00332B1521